MTHDIDYFTQPHLVFRSIHLFFQIPSPMPSTFLPPCEDDDSEDFLEIRSRSRKKGCEFLRKANNRAEKYCIENKEAREKCRATCSKIDGIFPYEDCSAEVLSTQRSIDGLSLVQTKRLPASGANGMLTPSCSPGPYSIDKDERYEWLDTSSSVCTDCTYNRLCTEVNYAAALEEKEREIMKECHGAIARCDLLEEDGVLLRGQTRCLVQPPDLTRCEGTCTYRMECTVELF